MELSVISYNVLAADFTHHNACFHGSDGREATWQTQARYAMGRPKAWVDKQIAVFISDHIAKEHPFKDSNPPQLPTGAGSENNLGQSGSASTAIDSNPDSREYFSKSSTL